MKRIEFLKKVLVSSVAAILAPFTLKSRESKKPKFSSLPNQVGFNHIPNKEISTENTVFHKANTRGRFNYGWLKTNHTFSFANYRNPKRMNFGVLRVLNDDIIAGGKGFSTHPHDNMEIFTIPLEGDLRHEDNMGNISIIKNGDVQIMSAGTGVKHSEFNANSDKVVELLQIWLFPKIKNVKPRYDQISLDSIRKKDEFYQILSPNNNDDGVWVYQNAWFSIGEFTQDKYVKYNLKHSQNGVYVFMIEGKATIYNNNLERRDGFGIWNISAVGITIKKGAKVLLMEVPMLI